MQELKLCNDCEWLSSCTAGAEVKNSLRTSGPNAMFVVSDFLASPNFAGCPNLGSIRQNPMDWDVGLVPPNSFDSTPVVVEAVPTAIPAENPKPVNKEKRKKRLTENDVLESLYELRSKFPADINEVGSEERDTINAQARVILEEAYPGNQTRQGKLMFYFVKSYLESLKLKL